MINADCKQINTDLFEVRFSDPNESFGEKPYELKASLAEINRILYTRNRNYLVSTISNWLNEREYDIKDPSELEQLHQVKARFSGALRITSYYNVCAEIRIAHSFLNSIAPPPMSRFHKHYRYTILPILNHCQEAAKN